jgi:hypothetical protein
MPRRTSRNTPSELPDAPGPSVNGGRMITISMPHSPPDLQRAGPASSVDCAYGECGAGVSSAANELTRVERRAAPCTTTSTPSSAMLQPVSGSSWSPMTGTTRGGPPEAGNRVHACDPTAVAGDPVHQLAPDEAVPAGVTESLRSSQGNRLKLRPSRGSCLTATMRGRSGARYVSRTRHS